jgi:drug/metabolite transporter (DMT)-like permease
LTHDVRSTAAARGIPLAVVSATSFGLSGSLARGLMDIGWTAGAATLMRVAIAALVLAVPGVMALDGRWHLLRRALPTVLAYGVFAVAGAQLCYFLAVGYLDVGVALLIEYTAPVAVVMWVWFRQGSKPSRLTIAGAGLGLAGLVLLLDVLGGGSVSFVGVGWALGAMVGAAVYFVVSADNSNGLPGITLAASGLVVALIVLGVAAITGLLPIAVSTGQVRFAGFSLPWWAVGLALGAITAALAYVTGIAAVRTLGARLASFVALTEVLAAATFAAILLGQTPGPVQLAGAALVLAGVVVVKMGERAEPSELAEPAIDVDVVLAVVATVAAVAAVAAFDSAEDAGHAHNDAHDNESKTNRV